MTEKEITLSAAAFLAASLSALRTGAPAPVLPEGVTDAFVARLAADHKLLPALYLSAGERIKGSDPALYASLTRAQSVAYLKNSLQAGEYAAIRKAFADEKIPYLPMKGFLFKDLYPRPELREMNDLDFFVGEENLSRAVEALKARGYTVSEEGYVHTTLRKPPAVEVELHAHISRKIDLSFSDFQPTDEPFRFALSPEDLFYTNLEHLYKHYLFGGCGVRGVFDFYLLSEAYLSKVDRPLLDRKLKKAGLSRFFSDLSALADFWFADQGALNEDFAYSVVRGGLFGDTESRAENYIREHGKFRYLLRMAFPAFSRMRVSYPWLGKLPVLLPVAYVIRLFGLLFSGKAGAGIRAMKNVQNEE